MIEPPSIILGIRQDRHVPIAIESTFDALENLHAIRIGDVEEHDSEGPAALATQRPSYPAPTHFFAKAKNALALL
jgi:hypothetical protein